MFSGLDSSGHEWSDESWCSLCFHDGRIRVYQCQGERFSDATVSEHDRYGGGSVMVWAGVTVNLKTQLCIIDDNLSAQHHVNEILSVVVPYLVQMQQGAIFQDDNARPHCGRVVNNFIRQQNIQKLKWPANLPDLNPIEHNIWDELGRRVYRLNLSQTLPQLRQQLMQEWVNILQRVISEYVQSMRRCCQACINARWGQTRYHDYDL